MAASVAMECCRLTLSWFIAHLCGYRRSVRNPTLKVAGFICPSLAGFDRPMTDMTNRQVPEVTPAALAKARTELIQLKAAS